MSRQKEMKHLLSKLDDQGWQIVKTSRGYQLREPKTGAIVHAHVTHSDWRSVKNLTALLRRHGAQLP